MTFTVVMFHSVRIAEERIADPAPNAIPRLDDSAASGAVLDPTPKDVHRC